MKILEINKFHFVKGGADRHFFDAIHLLRSKGHQVAVFSMDHPQNIFSPWKKYFPSYVGYNQSDSTIWQRLIGVARMFHSFEARNKIGKLLDDFRPEVVHLHNIYHQLSYSILPEIKKRNIPVVLTVHDYHLVSPDREQYFETMGRKYWMFFRLDKKHSFGSKLILVLKLYFEELLGYRNMIDLFIAPSQFVKERLSRSGIPQEKIIVLPHFDASTPNEDEEAKKNSPIHPRYALYFGRIYREKGVGDLIKLFDSFPDLKLYLAGEIEDDLKITSPEKIVYLGRLEKAALREYIQKAEFCISASTLDETFGLIALEANALGKPFVALSRGAYPEVVMQGVTGYLCHDLEELRKTIKKILTKELVFDEERIMRSVKERFGSDAYHQKLVSLFQSLIQ